MEPWASSCQVSIINESIHLNAHLVSTYCVSAVSQKAEDLPHGVVSPTVIKYHPREGHLHVSGES